MFAHLVGNHAEKMPSVGMIRLQRKDLPIDLLGGLQPAGLMVLDCNRQCFGNRCHDVNYDGTTCRLQSVSREPATGGDPHPERGRQSWYFRRFSWASKSDGSWASG
jgi:hypothetical protein